MKYIKMNKKRYYVFSADFSLTLAIKVVFPTLQCSSLFDACGIHLCRSGFLPAVHEVKSLPFLISKEDATPNYFILPPIES